MEFWKVVEDRHSIRDYRDTPVDRETLERLLGAAALAPSGENLQPWRYHVATGVLREEIGAIMAQATVHFSEYLEMKDPEDREVLVKWFSSLGDAPVVIGVSVADADSEMGRLTNLLSVGASIQNLLLAATAEGLGTCNITFGWWMRDELASAFNVGSGRSIVSIVTVGYPSDVPPVAPEHEADIADWYE